MFFAILFLTRNTRAFVNWQMGWCSRKWKRRKNSLEMRALHLIYRFWDFKRPGKETVLQGAPNIVNLYQKRLIVWYEWDWLILEWHCFGLCYYVLFGGVMVMCRCLCFQWLNHLIISALEIRTLKTVYLIIISLLVLCSLAYMCEVSIFLYLKCFFTHLIIRKINANPLAKYLSLSHCSLFFSSLLSSHFNS